jgi:Carboxypeptidase regulatory-like domain
MTSRRLYSRYWLSVLFVSGIALAFLASGCMWGVVKDANTGAPLRGATVTFTDSSGQTVTTTTDVNGLFGFGAPVSAAPARGPVKFQVESHEYPTMSETRDVLYNDNPNATFENMSTFWEVQVFDLAPPANRHHNEPGGYSITFPTDWQAEEMGGTGTQAVPRTGSPDAPAGCEIFSLDDPDQDYAEEFIRTYIIIMRQADAFQELERSESEIDMIPAVRLVYSYRANLKLGDRQVSGTFKDLVYVIEWRGRGYGVDCVTTSQRFGSMLGRFEEIAKTFGIG